MEAFLFHSAPLSAALTRAKERWLNFLLICPHFRRGPSGGGGGSSPFALNIEFGLKSAAKAGEDVGKRVPVGEECQYVGVGEASVTAATANYARL